MTLSKPRLAKIVRGQRSTFDRRRIVDRYIVAYYDDELQEYRRTFEVKAGGTPPAWPATLEVKS